MHEPGRSPEDQEFNTADWVYDGWHPREIAGVAMETHPEGADLPAMLGTSKLFPKQGYSLYSMRADWHDPRDCMEEAVTGLLRNGYTIRVPSAFVLIVTTPRRWRVDTMMEFRVSYFQNPFGDESELLVVIEHECDGSLGCRCRSEEADLVKEIVDEPVGVPFEPPAAFANAYKNQRQLIASWAAGRRRVRSGEEPRRGGVRLRLWEGLPRGAFAEVLLQLGSPCEVSLK